MKKFLLSSFIAAAAAVPALAGVDNINYQAVIKNGSEIVADKKVSLKFELLDKSEKVVYSEVQYPTTNAAGYVSCQLGQDNDLSEVDWSDLTLNVSVDLGSGYQVISSEAVSSVPSALYALRSADTDEIKEAVEGLMEETELNKETIIGINAEIVKFNGFMEEVEAFNDRLSETLEPMMGLNYEEINDFHERVNETLINLNEFKDDAENNLQSINDELAKIQGLNYEEVSDFHERVSNELARIDGVLETIKGNELDAYIAQLKNLKAELEAKLATISDYAATVEKVNALEGQVENLNMISAVVRENEEAIEGLQGDFKNLGENLTNSFTGVEAEIAEINGQLENLNNVSAVVRANEDAIEGLQGDFKNLGENLTNSFTGVEAEIAEINGQLENLNNVSAVVRANEEAIEELQGDFKNLGENLTNSFNGVEAEIAEINGQLENLTNFATVVNEEYATNEAVEAAFDRLQTLIDKMQKQIESLETEIADLKANK